jgi:hypothetical protein
MKKMGKKRKPGGPKKETSSKPKGPNYWMIVAIIAVFFSVGLVTKAVFFSDKGSVANTTTYQTPQTVSQPQNIALEEKVMAVSANFRCACGGCGELPLIECECDMTRGAKEEKAFMRRMFKEGLTVDQVIELVESKYGHRDI